MPVTGLFRQWTAAIISSLSILILGTSIGWPSPVLSAMNETGKPFVMTSEEISWMVSLLYLGNLASPIPSGILMDKIGRKNALVVLSILPMSGWVITYFASSAWMLFVARFLGGTWSGVVSTIVPMYLSEISDPKIRGALSTLIQMNTNIGVLLVYIIGPRVSYETLVLLCGCVPIIFASLFGIFLPESPYWYAVKGRLDPAAKSLAWLKGYKKKEEAMDEAVELERKVRENMQNASTFRELFATVGNRKALLIVEVLGFVQRMSGISVLMAYTSTTLPPRNVGILTVNDCVIVMGGVWLASVFLSTFLVDKLGRKPLLFVSCVGCGLSMFTAGLWFFLEAKTSVDVSECFWIPFASFLGYAVFFSIGLGPIASTVQGECFPANLRGIASGVTSIILALTSFFTNKIYHVISHGGGTYLNYWMFSGSCFIGAIFVIFYVVETKGKTFFEIQEMLSRKSKYHLAPVHDKPDA